MRFIVPLVAALVPLVIAPGWLSHFDVTPKAAILLFGSALILLNSRVNVHNVYKLLREPAGRWLVGLLAAAWFCSAAATLLSTHGALSLNGSNWRRLGLIPEGGLFVSVVLAAAWLASEPANVRTLLRACSASGGIAAAYGIAQYCGWDPLLPAKAYHVGEGAFQIVRPPGTLGHADYFAAWLVVIVFLALGLNRLETERWRQYAAVWVAALAGAAIILSGTRSAMLGLLVGGIVFAMAGRYRIRARGVVAGLACLAALALFFFSPAGGKLRARLHWSLEDARGGARLLLWKDSLGMAAARPLSGFGPETFATEFPRFESVELARAFPDFYHESPHNMFLDALTSRGALGFLVLLGFCGLGVWCIRRAIRLGASLAAPLAAALAGLLIAQQFMVFVLATSLYFYLVIALLATSASAENKLGGDSPQCPGWVLPTSLVISLLFAGYAVRLLVADAALAAAQREIASGDASGQAYRIALRWQLSGAGDDVSYSRAMQELSTHAPIFATRLAARQQAMEAGFRAVSSAEDRANAWYNLAGLLAGNNDTAGVEHALRNAIVWAPNWFKPHWALARVLALTGRRDEALAEARSAVERDGGHDAQVTETWNALEKRYRDTR
ncbi:MAG TPA: O-antigen ligase family protein [Bryobacteraceae bacterium]|nr:O-antigen ligase family protein [Bryobacteraceae bacterium]